MKRLLAIILMIPMLILLALATGLAVLIQEIFTVNVRDTIEKR